MNLIYLINEAGEAVISILAVLVVAALVYVLYYTWNKERIRLKQEKAIYIEGLKSKQELQNDITQYVSVFGTAVSFSLLQIEIRGLKDVEAAFGAPEAEKLVVKTAYKILDCLPGNTELARNKENEFIVFIKNTHDASYVYELCSNIISVIEQPISIMGHASVELDSNIGIVMYPIHGGNYKELMKNLSLAVYVAKKEGVNTCSMYSEKSSQEQLGNLEYYQQILDGIKNNEFCLYYQPIVDVETNEIKAFEGLLRWNHPTLGIIPPNKFLNVIEQSGDIKFIGIWSFETMVKQHFEVLRTFPSSKIKFHLNLSPKQLIDENIVNEITRIIKKYKINPTNYCFEVIEYAIYDKHPIVSLNIRKLKELGFTIATDNYGVDYSILNKIRIMPIDQIKLDKDFLVEDESSINPQLVQLLMKLCGETGKEVIALGIENKEMVDMIKEYGIGIAQGYYYSAPMSGDKLVDYITKFDGVSPDAKDEEEDIEEELVEQNPEEEGLFEEDEPVVEEKVEEEQVIEEEKPQE